MTNRSSNALLSPAELTALRRIAAGRTADVNSDHLKLLVDMGLAGLDMAGGATLTTDGERRLRETPAEQAA